MKHNIQPQSCLKFPISKFFSPSFDVDNFIIFANYFNLSLGVKLPINQQRQAIIIAPYFKYSLKPLTKQQIDFNSGGVHLRYNFSISKNK